jgi:hypothetical protein
MSDCDGNSAFAALAIGEIAIDPSAGVAAVAGTTLPIGSKVVATLLALHERSGEVVPKADLLARVWGATPVDESSLWQNVHLLRRVLAKHAPSARIETVKGRGYRLILAEPPVAELPTAPAPTAVPARPRLPAWLWSLAGAAAASIAFGVAHGLPRAPPAQRVMFVRTDGSLPPLPPLVAGQRALIVVRSVGPGLQQ